MHIIKHINFFDLHLSEDRSYLLAHVPAELSGGRAPIHRIRFQLLGDHAVLYLIVQLRHHFLVLLGQRLVFHKFRQGKKFFWNDLGEGV
jgi:hypothetical protein